MVPAFREMRSNNRKALADTYRILRRNDEGSLARMLWKTYKEARRKYLNHILYGVPLE